MYVKIIDMSPTCIIRERGRNKQQSSPKKIKVIWFRKLLLLCQPWITVYQKMKQTRNEDSNIWIPDLINRKHTFESYNTVYMLECNIDNCKIRYKICQEPFSQSSRLCGWPAGWQGHQGILKLIRRFPGQLNMYNDTTEGKRKNIHS